ncbi:related to transporter protein HOL1 [Rhynchosporium secalis]|uniref:Related to transporter protein HOL1 n=1 Tax=Rhynchosporium secalis TaxID=38038 RepID=A0A1E1M0U3_RHYSE|nr:related to transporter protein HOL1 [Rhynchosporium secalis]
MGLWILESSSEHVPGTTRYFDDPERPQVATSETAGLKCDTSGPVPIILVPQPSDDPNDPLNWPLQKRDTIVLILCIVAIFATSLGSILAANTITLSLLFARRFDDIAVLTGYFLLGCGVGGILCVPTARIWGKRHLFILGTVIVIISSVWAGASTSYRSLLWARIFQGVGTAPFEALVNAAVGDLYFVHERGKRMAITNLAVFGSAFFTPIVVGKMTHTIGWPWTFYMVAIFTAACLPLVVLYVPETAYRRSSHLNTDLVTSQTSHSHSYTKSDDNGHLLQTLTQQQIANTEHPANPLATPNNTLEANSGTAKKGFAQSLALIHGRFTDDSFWKLLLRPFPLFLHPAVFWATIIQGSMIGWTVFIGIILAAIFIGPPLLWGEVNTGYAYTGAFLGAVIGFLIAGALADWSAKYLTRKNNGVYEPEFRIVLVIPQLIFGCGGLYLFGITANKLSDYSYVLPITGFGMEVGGMVIGAVAASLYIVDAHRDIAVEAFTCILIFKNFFTCGLTFSAYGWLLQSDVYGKRNRNYFHKHDILKISGLA